MIQQYLDFNQNELEPCACLRTQSTDIRPLNHAQQPMSRKPERIAIFWSLLPKRENIAWNFCHRFTSIYKFVCGLVEQRNMLNAKWCEQTNSEPLMSHKTHFTVQMSLAYRCTHCNYQQSNYHAIEIEYKIATSKYNASNCIQIMKQTPR